MDLFSTRVPTSLSSISYSSADVLEISLEEANLKRQLSFGMANFEVIPESRGVKADKEEANAEQITTARLGAESSPKDPIQHRRTTSLVSKSSKSPLVLVLRQSGTFSNMRYPSTSGIDNQQLWKDVGTHLQIPSETQLSAELRDCKEELICLKAEKTREKTDLTALVSDLETQVHTLKLENAELKRSLLTCTRAKSQLESELQRAELSLLEASGKLQSLLLNEIQLKDAFSEQSELLLHLDREKQSVSETKIQLEMNVSRLEEELQQAYTKIQDLEKDKKTQKAQTQAYYMKVGPPDLMTEQGVDQPIYGSLDGDLLDLKDETPRKTLISLVSEARKRIFPAEIETEIQNLEKKQGKCKTEIAALGTENRREKAELELELLLLTQSLDTALERQRRFSRTSM